MRNMETYKRPEKRMIDISSWRRRDNYEFFSNFINPNLGVTVRVDAGHAYCVAREKGVSFFLCYFHAILSAANEIEEFRYRIPQTAWVSFIDGLTGASACAYRRPRHLAGRRFLPVEER